MTSRRMLEGLRVLDVFRIIACPYCARLLADLSADVVTLAEGYNARDPT
jgi:crotonobetainyl-CoA:carnitine CoA-transferase CaiB-like acyl-CoA transferase